MKTQRLDFNFAPLRVLHSLGPSSTVPAAQSYDASQNIWVPDYTTTYLLLQESIDIIDPDQVMPNGSVLQSLASLEVWEVIDGVQTLITPDNPNYVISKSGGTAGQIIVKKNAVVEHPMTIRVKATFNDTRLKQLITVYDSYLIICKNATTLQVAEVDTPQQSVFDPFHDADLLPITGAHRVGTTLSAYDPAKLQFRWYYVNSDNTTREITGQNDEDFPFTISGDCHETLNVNRRLMGSACSIRMQALYDASGSGTFAVTPWTPAVEISMRRRVPDIDYDIMGLPPNIPPGTEYVSPTCSVMDTLGVIPDPLSELMVVWLRATNKASANGLVYEPCAWGLSPQIQTNVMSSDYGMLVGVDVQDLGPLLPVTDADGKVLTDADGKILFAH